MCTYGLHLRQDRECDKRHEDHHGDCIRIADRLRCDHRRNNFAEPQNLTMFCQIAEGIDEDTWTYHLRRGDYSSWFRFAVRDDFLADAARRIEQRVDIAPLARQMITELVDARYTVPE